MSLSANTAHKPATLVGHVRQLLAAGAVVGAALLSVASAPEPTPDAWKYQSDFDLDVGYGWEPYVSYADANELPMERGFQGGQHIYTSVRAFDVEPVDEADGPIICTLSLVNPEAPDGEPLAIETDTDCELGTPASLDTTAPEGFPEGALMAPSLRLVIEDDNIAGDVAELGVQIELPNGQVGRAWFEAPVTWFPYCDDMPEDYPYPCNW